MVCVGAVTDVVAAAGVNAVDLTWTNPADPSPEGIYVEVDGPQPRVIALPGDPTHARVDGLRNGVEVRFRVVAATRGGSAEPSEWVTATPTTGAEGVVAGLIVKFNEPVNDGQGAVPGESRVDDVDLTVGEPVTDDATLVNLSEPVDLATAEQIATDLAADSAVEWAEPDRLLLTAAIDQAPVSSDSWNLAGAFGVDADASDSTAGQGVTVAVIDTGMTSHPSLDARTVPGYDFVSSPDGLAAERRAGDGPVAFDADEADTATYGAVGRDANPSDPGDWRDTSPARASSWHGTAMAGVIANVAPGAKIEPVRALSWRGGLLSDIAASVTWASGGTVDGAPANANPANVVNMSFAVEAACPTALQAAIDDARARGSILVAAAGNAGDDASKYAPGNCDGVITVGATTSDGVRASYSNYGSTVDLSAPGGDSTTPVISASNTGTTNPGAPTTSATSGTSVAAAHVSAAAAVLAGRTTNLTPDDAFRTLTGREYVKRFAANACDVDPARSCGTGITTLGESLAQIAAAGDTDYYMSFNGVNQRAKAAAGFYPVRNATGESFTFSAWVYDAEVNSGYQYVAAQSNNADFYIGTRLNSQEIRVSGWDTGVLVPVNQWVHIAVVRSGTTATLYYNGAVAAVTGGYAVSSLFSNQPFRIGSYIDDRAEFWKGAIDQVKVYDTALTAAQVASDMQSWGAASGVSSSSLVAAYDVNEGSGVTLSNQGSQGSAGNLTTENGPTWSTVATSSTSGTTTTVTFPRSVLTSGGGWIAPAGVTRSTALVVGGGGGGGYDGGGAGGGGGVYSGTQALNAGGANVVIVGGGGSGRLGYNPSNNCWDGNSVGVIGCSGNDGTGTQFAGATATGGGGGGGKNANGRPNAGTGTSTGSGGGGGSGDNSFVGQGGSGTYSGGNGSNWRAGGGGGGASAAGTAGSNLDNAPSGAGGGGVTSALSGTSRWYGTGGSGGAWACTSCIVDMSANGAGTGGYGTTSATWALANQGGGGGGGGGSGTIPGYGGSGVVIATYSTLPDAPTSFTATAGQQEATLSWTAPAYTGGSAVTGYQVQVEPTGGSWSNPSAGTCTSASTSTATTCTITGLTAGVTYSFQIQAINGNGSGNWVQSNSAVPYGALSTFAISAVSSPQVAGTAFTVTITAQDSGSRTVTSFTGTVDLTSTSLFGASSGGTTAAFTNGVLSNKSVTLTRAGATQTITATKTGSTETGTSNTFTINTGTATKLQTLLPGETAAPGTATGKTGTPTQQSAGTAFIATVNAVDANWNVVAAQTPSVHLTSTDGAATLPANAALVSGTKAFTVTLNTVGSQTITAADVAAGLTSGTSASVTVGKAAQAALTVTSTSGTFGQPLTLTTSGGSTGGAVTYTAADGTALGCTVSGAAPYTLSVTQAGTCQVTATMAGDATYDPVSSAATTVTFGRAQQAPLTITSPSTVVFGDTFTLSTSGGSGTGAVSFSNTGTGAACTVSSGSTNTVTGTGVSNVSNTCEVTAEKAGDVNYDQVLTSQIVTVTTRPITVTASSPSIAYGGTVAPTVSVTTGTLAFSNAISGATFTYTGTGATTYGPSTTAPTAVGTYSVMPSAATFSNGSASNYAIQYAAGTLTIGRASQTITFVNPQPSGLTFGAAPFVVSATATSGLTVTFTTANPAICTVTGTTVSITGAGTCSITAAQGGDGTFTPAADVTQQFTVAQAAQATLVMSSAASAAFGQTITLAATGGSGTGAVTFAVTSPTGAGLCSAAGSTLTLGDAGSLCKVRATRAGDVNYTSVQSVEQTITIVRAGNALAFTSAVPSTPLPGGTYTPVVTSTNAAAGGATGITPTVTVATASAAVCSISGGVVTFNVAGSCVLEANAAQTTNFTAAQQATQTITVGSLNQTITFTQPSNRAYGSADVAMSALASSGLQVTFTLGAGTTNNACVVSTLGVVSVRAVGACEVIAAQAGDSVYAAASDVARVFNVVPVLPSAPFITSISAGDQSMTLSYVEPNYLGGAPISAYAITATPVGGGAVLSTSACSPTAVPLACTITGLANGTSYTFAVAAINAAGTGPSAAVATPWTPATAAFAVSGLTALTANASLALNWTPLTTAQLGGGSFTRYDVAYRVAGTSTWSTWNATLTNVSDHATTITGLTNGTTYDLKVVAITSANASEIAGNTALAMGFPATAPSPPVSVTALTSTATDVRVSWQVPANNGGAPLISPYYSATITSTDPGAVTPITCVFTTPGDTHCTATGLTNGATYTFSVTATNRVGTSLPGTTTYAVPSADATLASLVVDAGGAPVALTPGFTPGGTAYAATVANGVASATVTPTPTNSFATVEVNGVVIASGTASAPIALAVGANTIAVLVTASDPRYTQTTTITITRAPAVSPDDPNWTGDWVGGTNIIRTPPASVTAGTSPVGVLVNGQPATGTTFTRNPNGAGWTIALSGRGGAGSGTGGASGSGESGSGSDGATSLSVYTTTATGTPVAMAAAGVMRVPQGGTVVVDGTGYEPGSQLNAFVLPRDTQQIAALSEGMSARAGAASASRPVWLGEVTVGTSGQVQATFTVPVGVDVGSYVLQVNGMATGGVDEVSANLLLDVIAPAQPRAGQARRAGFFEARSARLSETGRTRLLALVKAIPQDATGVVLDIVGVSLSMPTAAQNASLAAKRAQRIVTFLERQGVTGKFRKMLYLEGSLSAPAAATRTLALDSAGTITLTSSRAAGDGPVVSSAGRPLTTATATFTVLRS